MCCFVLFLMTDAVNVRLRLFHLARVHKTGKEFQSLVVRVPTRRRWSEIADNVIDCKFFPQVGGRFNHITR